MAKKNKEPFVEFPRDLYDALLEQRLSITQERAFLYIIRKTYGFHKTEDKISISRMAEETGFSRRAMSGAVHDLIKMGMVKTGTPANGQPSYLHALPPSYWDRTL